MIFFHIDPYMIQNTKSTKVNTSNGFVSKFGTEMTPIVPEVTEVGCEAILVAGTIDSGTQNHFRPKRTPAMDLAHRGDNRSPFGRQTSA